MKTFRLKAIMMDYATNELFVEGGLKAVRREYERSYTNHTFIDVTFNTEAERDAYIMALNAMEEMELGYFAILHNRCEPF